LVQSPAAMPHPCAQTHAGAQAGQRERLIKLFYYMQVPDCPALPHMLA
jgi:hypothetical protein